MEVTGVHLKRVVYIYGTEKNRAVQGGGGVHLSLSPELGNRRERAFREGVHLEGVHLEGVDCIWLE